MGEVGKKNTEEGGGMDNLFFFLLCSSKGFAYRKRG